MSYTHLYRCGCEEVRDDLDQASPCTEHGAALDSFQSTTGSGVGPVQRPRRRLMFSDIPQLPRAHYSVTVGWDYLEEHIRRQLDARDGLCALNLDPDYQRAHVWTEAQQRAYVEYSLQGGEVGRRLTLNCPGWMEDWRGPYELVDGKQRLTAVRRFLSDDLRVFGQLFSDFAGPLRMTSTYFDWSVCALETRAEVLRLYLNINAGGTPHTASELDRVRSMLAMEASQ